MSSETSIWSVGLYSLHRDRCLTEPTRDWQTVMSHARDLRDGIVIARSQGVRIESELVFIDDRGVINNFDRAGRSFVFAVIPAVDDSAERIDAYCPDCGIGPSFEDQVRARGIRRKIAFSLFRELLSTPALPTRVPVSHGLEPGQMALPGLEECCHPDVEWLEVEWRPMIPAHDHRA